MKLEASKRMKIFIAKRKHKTLFLYLMDLVGKDCFFLTSSITNNFLWTSSSLWGNRSDATTITKVCGDGMVSSGMHENKYWFKHGIKQLRTDTKYFNVLCEFNFDPKHTLKKFKMLLAHYITKLFLTLNISVYTQIEFIVISDDNKFKLGMKTHLAI